MPNERLEAIIVEMKEARDRLNHAIEMAEQVGAQPSPVTRDGGTKDPPPSGPPSHP